MSDNRTTGQPESEARSGDGGQSGRDIGLFSFFRDYGGIDRSERDSTQQQQQAGGNKSSSGGKKADSSNVRLHLDVLETRSKTPVFVYLVTLCSAVGGFLCGFDMGMISGAMILLRRRFALSLEWQELLVGAAVGSAAVFALLAGIINCHVGRKPIILAVGPIFAVGTVIMAASQNKTLLLIGRIVVGASIGKEDRRRRIRHDVTDCQCLTCVQSCSTCERSSMRKRFHCLLLMSCLHAMIRLHVRTSNYSLHACVDVMRLLLNAG